MCFVSELNIRWTFRSLNMVQAGQWTILRFLTYLLLRGNLQPKLCCAGCTYVRVHILTHNTCSLSSIHSWKPCQWTPRLCHTLTYLLVFICWVPQIKLTLPQVHKWDYFLQSKWLKTFTLSAMCCCPIFFLFHRRALRFQPIKPKVHQTQRIVPTACRAKRFGPWTQFHCNSLNSNCPNMVHEVKVCQIKNEVHQTFYRFNEHPN